MRRSTNWYTSEPNRLVTSLGILYEAVKAKRIILPAFQDTGMEDSRSKNQYMVPNNRKHNGFAGHKPCATASAKALGVVHREHQILQGPSTLSLLSVLGNPRKRPRTTGPSYSVDALENAHTSVVLVLVSRESCLSGNRVYLTSVP